MKTTIESTKIYKGRDGWQGESMSSTDANGNAWSITTYKGRGNVHCYAIEGKNENGNFSYMMFGCKRLELGSIDGQCNEKKVRDCHALGLAKFAELMEAEEAQQEIKPLYVVGVGQIIFTDWINGGDESKRVIYEVTSPGNYKTVSLNGETLQHDDYVRPYTEKFGIGVYYNEGDILPADEVLVLVERAKVATVEREEAAQIAKDAAHNDRLAKIEKGKEIISAIPAGVVSVIVAESRYDKSDLQSDYHAYGTDDVVYLAWSTHKRDIFAEMRKACLNSDNEEIKRFSVAPEKPEDGGEYWSAPDEHREKYSMGAGYYLGDSKYHGWIIKKSSVSVDGAGYGISLETLQIAAAEGRFLCGDSVAVVDVQETINVAPVSVVTGKIDVISYGEKAIAVVGDTKPIKDLLKSLGGRFNFRLSCGAGWIFPKTQLEKVTAALSGTTQQEDSRRHPEVETAHPLNICDPSGGQYKQALIDHENFNYAG